MREVTGADGAERALERADEGLGVAGERSVAPLARASHLESHRANASRLP